MADGAHLVQPVRGDNGDSFSQRTQELDSPANLVGHQAVHVGHALCHAASETGQNLLPRLVHHASKQNLVGDDVQAVRFKQLNLYIYSKAPKVTDLVFLAMQKNVVRLWSRLKIFDYFCVLIWTVSSR